jgi:hypothetical protein
MAPFHTLKKLLEVFKAYVNIHSTMIIHFNHRGNNKSGTLQNYLSKFYGSNGRTI